MGRATSATEPVSGASTSAQFDTRNNQVANTNELGNTSIGEQNSDSPIKGPDKGDASIYIDTQSRPC
jgi:hypothetical protein